MMKCAELWEFIRLSVFMHGTAIGYSAAAVVIGLSVASPLPELWTDFSVAMVGAFGATWMAMMMAVAIMVPFSGEITRRNWEPFVREARKLDRGEHLDPDRVDEVELVVEKEGLPFTATITFVVMLFISDMAKSRNLRLTNRVVTTGLTLIGSSALVLTGNLFFGLVWLLYHASIDMILFRAVAKARDIERSMTT